MPLNSIGNDELRAQCKRIIENLELWLRRFINDRLIAEYGPDYLNSTKPDGDFRFRAKIRNELTQKVADNPTRFSRPIDAATLEQEIYFVCHPDLYTDQFKDGLVRAFPDGREECRTFLNRLIDPRNRLYHANQITVRDAERVICYSNDIIDSLKKYYTEINVATDYNAPTVIRISDSLGGNFHAGAIPRNKTRRGHIDRSDDPGIALRPGDSFSIEAEIDSSFDPNTYSVSWNVNGDKQDGNRAVVVLGDGSVTADFMVWCHVVSNKAWHRLGDLDDCVMLRYAILPPIDDE